MKKREKLLFIKPAAAIRIVVACVSCGELAAVKKVVWETKKMKTVYLENILGINDQPNEREKKS